MWVKARKYYELKGDTPGGLKAKRRAGHYRDGVHVKVAGDGNIWVNLEAVDKWVETSINPFPGSRAV